MKNQFTWGQAVEETLRTRPAWRNGPGRIPSIINCGHFTRYRGLSFPCNSITITVMEDLGVELEEEGKKDATINRVTAAVSTVLNHCARRDRCNKPPSFTKRKEDEQRLSYLTKDQFWKLHAAALNPFGRKDLADIMAVAAFTGMRQGELLKLKCRDVSLSEGLIHVGGLPDQRTKSRNYRAIPIHSCINSILSDRLKYADPSIQIFGDEWSSRYHLLRVFKDVRKYVGYDDRYIFHTLRHSFATWHAEAGTPIRTLMGLCGHKSIETTLRYARHTDQAAFKAMNAI